MKFYIDMKWFKSWFLIKMLQKKYLQFYWKYFICSGFNWRVISISHETSDHKTLQSFKGTRSVARVFKLIWSLASASVAVLLRHLPNFKALQYEYFNTPVLMSSKGAIWPSLSPCTVINPILLTCVFKTERDHTIRRLMWYWISPWWALAFVFLLICKFNTMRPRQNCRHFPDDKFTQDFTQLCSLGSN